MNRIKGRMLAAVLAAATFLSSFNPGAVLAAEPAEADTSVEAFSVPGENGNAEDEAGEPEKEVETPAEEAGEDLTGEAAAIEGEEKDMPAESLSDDGDGEQEDDREEFEDSSETDKSGSGATEDGMQARPGEDGGQADTGETAAPASEEEKEPESREEETSTGRLAVRFDSGDGVVKIIMSDDGEASEDDPSYILEKKGDGGITVTERSGDTYAASVTEEGYALEVEEDDGGEVTVIAEAAEGFHVSRYSVTTDAGGGEEAGFEGAEDRYSHTFAVRGDDRKVVSVGFEKDEAKDDAGRIAFRVSPAGGSVTVTSGEDTYTIAADENGKMQASDKEGDPADAEDDHILTVEGEPGSSVTVRAAADEGHSVTGFAVAGADGSPEETAFKADDAPAEFEQEIMFAEGRKTVTVSFSEMPEFTAEQKTGRYVVKVHAPAGVFPAGTTFTAKEMSEAESEPYVKKAEKMAEAGVATAVIDIRFLDREGKEIQPKGTVEVTFENAARDDASMSVYHAVDSSVDKMEAVPSGTEGDSVLFECDSFSPFVLMAASGEPDWTKGGKGTRRDVSKEVSITSRQVHHYPYDSRDYGSWNTASYTALLNDDRAVGYTICMDPRLGGDVVGETGRKVYEINAPMLVKAFYYGAYGPGRSVIQGVTGTDDVGTNNIVTHVAAAEIYARLGYAYKSGAGDGFIDTTNSLKEDVKAFVRAIEGKSVPDDYLVYIVEYGPSDQDFGFGSIPLTKQDGSVKVKKTSANPSVSNGNRCYSLAGATYWIYTSAAAASARGNAGRVSGGTLVTDATGNSGAVSISPGTYYLIEITAPPGFILSDEVYKFTVTGNKTTTVSVLDEPGNDPIVLSIIKKCTDGEEKKANSLEGTEFTVRYYDGYYAADSIPSEAERTWVIQALETNGIFASGLGETYKVSGDDFYKNGKTTILPLGTVTIEETKAVKGYINDGKFGDADMYIGQVRLNSAGTDVVLVDIQGKRTTANSFEVKDTPKAPEIRTKAVNKASGAQTAFAGGEITIEDTVSYTNLIVGEVYTLKGRLMDKETGEPVKDTEGRDVTAETEFTAEDIDGSVKMAFTFMTDGSFAGKSIVAFESVETGGVEVAVHTDLNDGDQTIHFPKIGTTAVNPDTDDHILMAGEGAVIKDSVSYENLVPGEEYSIRGTLMLKPEERPLVVDGKEVTIEKTFTPENADGRVDVEFNFDATGLEGKGLVVFEEVYAGNSLVGEHKDPDDRDQTVHFPGVETDAYDKDTEKKNTLAAKDRVIIDEVTYKNLIPGKSYEIRGTVKVKAEDATDFDGAETVPSQIIDAKGEGDISFDATKVIFTPAGNSDETVSGKILVSFKIDASELAGEEIVVGETLRYKNVDIAVHRDIEDTRQNDLIPNGRTVSVDTATGIKNTLAAENRVFKDTFSYEKLIPGETYRFTGRVMVSGGTDEDGAVVLEEIPSVMTDENGVPVEKGCVEFVPEEQDGELDLYFSIDASELENRDVTVFERVTLDGEPVIVHEVLDGTQTVYVPEGKTQAIDSETRDQIAMPDEEVTVVDTLVYRNLVPGTAYTVRGRVMRKDDASEVPSVLTEAAFKTDQEEGDPEAPAGTVSVADSVVTFTPGKKDGALELTFVFDGSGLKGEDTVIFERVYHNDAEVIVHENIDDVSQTIHFPDGHTEAADPDTDDRTMKAGGEVTIRDRFYYENLIPGDEYVVRGKVMLKPEGGEEAQELEARMADSEGNEVEEWVFTPSEEDGSEDLYFIFNSDGLAGRSVVMFETLEFINPELQTRSVITVHEDIDDEEQTVHFPDGRTTALDSETGSHTANADDEVTILDEVKYINLIPGKMYSVTGTLLDKETGREVTAGGRIVTSTKEFVPDTPNGSVIVEFTFNGADLAGRSVVASESVRSNGKEVFVHADLEDEDQKIDFPEIRTSAVDKKDGDQEISYKGTVRVADTVTYKNLMPGSRYRIRGILMNKSTGQPAGSGGREITGETEFTPARKDGSIEVVFSFDSSGLADGEYVVYEKIYEINAETGDENLVGRHEDIDDQAQTVKRRTPPGTPRTGDDSSALPWLAVLGFSALGIAGAVIVRKRRSGR